MCAHPCGMCNRLFALSHWLLHVTGRADLAGLSPISSRNSMKLSPIMTPGSRFEVKRFERWNRKCIAMDHPIVPTGFCCFFGGRLKKNLSASSDTPPDFFLPPPSGWGLLCKFLQVKKSPLLPPTSSLLPSNPFAILSHWAGPLPLDSIFLAGIPNSLHEFCCWWPTASWPQWLAVSCRRNVAIGRGGRSETTLKVLGSTS